jgi:hypothetical protein
MNPYYNISGLRSGTIGGTLCTIFINIRYQDVADTALLAAIGAIVSFIVSLGLKIVVRQFKK